MKSITVFVCSVAIAGCSFFGGNENEYLQAKISKPLQLPPDLDSTRIRPLMVIPDASPALGTAVTIDPVDPRPVSALSASDEQYIKIQRLGERYWLVIDEPPSVVWPRLKQFLADNGVPLVAEQPEAGRITSDWFDLTANAQDLVRRSVLASAPEAAVGSRTRLFFRVEPGIRESATEIHVRQSIDQALPLAWPDKSTWLTAEDKLLNEIGAYLATNVGGAAVSFAAQGIERASKAMLRQDGAGQPELLFKLDFDRTWATIGQALAKAELEVADLNRDQGLFYLVVSENDLQEQKPGWITGWFVGDSERHELTLQLTQAGDEGFRVALAPDSAAKVDATFAEQLLLVLKSHSG